MTMQCPNCGKYLSQVKASIRGPDREIESVVGTCRRCGLVEPVDWSWEDFFPESGETHPDDMNILGVPNA